MARNLTPIQERQILRAAKLYEGFHGIPVDEIYTAKISSPDPEIALVVGQLHGVSYKALGDGETYFHKFNARNRPLFASSFDGQQLYILKGGYRFTTRGIVG